MREPALATKTYPQSGVIPYWFRNGELEILLVTNRTGTKWVVPKGLIEEDMTAAASAEKEAHEEAGIEGRVYNTAVGYYEYRKWGGVCRVQIFPMHVDTMHDTWSESFRKRSWLSAAEAAERVSSGGLNRLLRGFPEFLKEKGIS